MKRKFVDQERYLGGRRWVLPLSFNEPSKPNGVTVVKGK